MTAADCTPRHEVRDEAKVDLLAASMASNGWTGSPVVLLDTFQITGVHRRAAWESLGKSLREMPAIDLFEICPELQSEWEEICADACSIGEYEIESLLLKVPAEIAAEFGIEQ